MKIALLIYLLMKKSEILGVSLRNKMKLNLKK